jgi:hypothetical protein
VVALGVLGVGQNPKEMIVGTVTDALGGGPVYKARIVIGGRSTIRYMDKSFQITHLTPGIHTLNVSAPGYESVAKEVVVKRGTTRVDIRMRGIEISGLDHILVFADSIRDRGIQLELRFVNKEGVGIKHFPRLPMRMDATLYARRGTQKDYTRGRVIYSGPVDLYWDAEASLGKNKGIIARGRLTALPEIDGRYGVLDVILHIPQGDYSDTRTDVLLEW